MNDRLYVHGTHAFTNYDFALACTQPLLPSIRVYTM